MAFSDFFKPKWKNSNPAIRIKAILENIDQSIIIEVVKNDKDTSVRLAALKKLTDQSVIAEVAKNDKDSFVRLEALKKVTDQSVLNEVVKKDNDSSVRLYVLGKLTNQSIIAEVVKNDYNSSVRLAALEKVKDQAVLAEVAKNDNDGSVRLTAIEKVSEQSLLSDVAKFSENNDVQIEALKKLTDPSFIADVAKFATDSCICLEAVKKISNASILVDVAKNGVNSNGRQKAIERITDLSVLSDIAENDPNRDVRLTAKYRYKDIKEFQDLDNRLKELQELRKNVKIGNQTWMVNNLNVCNFRNGDLIPEAKTDLQWKYAGAACKPAWCHYENEPDNGTQYGKLYNWFAVIDPRGLSPKGWHVPTDEEWSILSGYLGGDNLAGRKMKSLTGWISGEYSDNSSGFSGLPGGARMDLFGFGDCYFAGTYWSSSEHSPSDAWARSLFANSPTLNRWSNPKYEGNSVRCIKDS